MRGDLLRDARGARARRSRAGQPNAAWRERTRALVAEWNQAVDAATRAGPGLPTDAQVLGAVNRALGTGATVVCAAGGLPGELHKLWRCPEPGGYHVEYGYSCMGYEIAGGLGVKMAEPGRTVAVLVGDGSYLMMNSEIATSVASGHPLLVVLCDNRGFGCIHRLQRATAGETHNNLLEGIVPRPRRRVDFVAHARALGADALKVAGRRSARGRGREGTERRAHDRDRHRDRPAERHRRGRRLVERAGRRSVRRTRACAPRTRPGAAQSMTGRRRMSVRLGINPLTWTIDDLPEVGGETQPRDLPHRGARRGLRGRRARLQVPAHRARAQGGARTARPRARLRLVQHRTSSCATRRRNSRRCARTASSCRALGCEVVVVAETTRCIHGDRRARLSQRPVLAPADWPRFAERLDELGARLQDAGSRSPTITTWARSCRPRTRWTG